ncbi:MAG: two-component system nitrate/nitrite response regulator NarL [Candidatus Endobugula sp.]
MYSLHREMLYKESCSNGNNHGELANVRRQACTVMIVDDHTLLRKGLNQLLEFGSDLTAVAEASFGQKAIKLALEFESDLIALDLNMQGMDGLETLKHMRDKGIGSRIVMLTVSDNDEDVVEVIRAGADGYLLKNMDTEEIVDKLREAALEKMVMSAKLT